MSETQDSWLLLVCQPGSEFDLGAGLTILAHGGDVIEQEMRESSDGVREFFMQDYVAKLGPFVMVEGFRLETIASERLSDPTDYDYEYNYSRIRQATHEEVVMAKPRPVNGLAWFNRLDEQQTRYLVHKAVNHSNGFKDQAKLYEYLDDELPKYEGRLIAFVHWFNKHHQIGCLEMIEVGSSRSCLVQFMYTVDEDGDSLLRILSGWTLDDRTILRGEMVGCSRE